MPTSWPAWITTTAPMPFSAISRMASTTGASGPIAKTSGALASSRCRTLRMAPSLPRMDLPRGYPGRRLQGIDQVQGPLLGLVVQPAQVLADQAEGDQLGSAQEQDHRHHRRPAGDRVAPEQG